MGRYVIALYRPKPGKARQLRKVVRAHLPVLRAEGLATPAHSLVLVAADGTLLEIFEWKSDRAAERAHGNPAVRKLWADFDACCTFRRLADLKEAKEMFPHFTPVKV